MQVYIFTLNVTYSHHYKDQECMSEITMQTVCTVPHQTSRWTETVNLPFTRPTIHPLLQTIYYHCIYTITHSVIDLLLNNQQKS